MTGDPIALELANHRLAAIADEMGVVLGRTAHLGTGPSLNNHLADIIRQIQ